MNIDGYASTSHRNLIEHLIGPLRAGAQESTLAVSAAGMVERAGPSREPLVLAAPRYSLDDLGLSLTIDLPGGGSIATVDYAPGTEAGAHLPLHRPTCDPQTGMAAPFALRLCLVLVRGAQRQVVPSQQIDEHIDVRLLEGILGRIVYLLGAEKQRLRRQARIVAGARTLDGASGDALDRIGAELAVPRFLDTIRFQAGEVDQSIFGTFDFGDRPFGPGTSDYVTTEARREPDDEYRRRLAIYRPWLYPTHDHISTMLNGPPGGAGDPTSGLLASIGVPARVAVTETAHPLAAAVHLVAVGDPTARAGLLAYLRRTTLVWPEADATADAAHAQRYLPDRIAHDIAELRRRLRNGFAVAPGTALAPVLARVLDRVARCRRALGATGSWPLLRGQDPTGGSRYELGLGADLRPLPAAELDELATRCGNGQLTLPPAPTDGEPDPAETAALLRAATPRSAADDPDGAWLLRACGLSTVHRVSATVLYVSHVPTLGLTITGASTASVGDAVPLAARYHAPGEPGSHVLLVQGLAAAAQDWAALGHPPWQVLTAPEAVAAWGAAVPTPAPTRPVIEAVGLPVVTSVPVLDPTSLPGELVATLRLHNSQAQRIITGNASAVADLRDLLRLLTAQGLSSALLLVLPSSVVVVVGGIGLPLAGNNLAERAATRFRWYVARIWPAGEGPEPGIRAVGSRTEFHPAADGLYAIVCLGQIRTALGGTEPYEFTVDLPQGVTLSLLQYEYLMNLLDHVHPAGTRVNTWSIRQRHVDLDGDGTAKPVPSAISRTYRRFRRERFRGQVPDGS